MSISFFIANCEDESLTINMANGNFYSFMSTLGYKIDLENDDIVFGMTFDYGYIQPIQLNEKLKNLIPELAIRNEYQEGNHISCGLTLEQINRYISKLKEMCEYAMKSEKLIHWA